MKEQGVFQKTNKCLKVSNKTGNTSNKEYIEMCTDKSMTIKNL